VSSPREVGAHTPLTESRGGGEGASAWGGRRSACRQAIHDRGGAGRGGAGVRRGGGVCGHGGGNAGRARSACRTLEEEEARLLYPKVRNRSSRHPVLEGRGFDFSHLCVRRVTLTVPPPLRLLRR
jgi:hypothetical protein